MSENIRPEQSAVDLDFHNRREKDESLGHRFLYGLPFVHSAHGFVVKPPLVQHPPGVKEKIAAVRAVASNITGFGELLGKGNSPAKKGVVGLVLGMIATGASISNGKLVPLQWHVDAMNEVLSSPKLRNESPWADAQRTDYQRGSTFPSRPAVPVAVVLHQLREYLSNPAAIAETTGHHGAYGKDFRDSSRPRARFRPPRT